MKKIIIKKKRGGKERKGKEKGTSIRPWARERRSDS
jgi:hypothetical protein